MTIFVQLLWFGLILGLFVVLLFVLDVTCNLMDVVLGGCLC